MVSSETWLCAFMQSMSSGVTLSKRMACSRGVGKHNSRRDVHESHSASQAIAPLPWLRFQPLALPVVAALDLRILELARGGEVETMDLTPLGAVRPPG